MLILICDAFDAGLPERLAKYGECTTDMARLPEAHVALVRSKTRADRAFLDKAKSLRLVVRGGVGLDNVDTALCAEREIIVRNTPEASSIAVAEMTMALMLAVPNKIVDAHNSMVEGKWLKKELKRTELYGKTLGLLGMGRIGTEVALRCNAFGMKIVAYDRGHEPSTLADLLEDVDQLYAVADYISLHLPLTDETRGMINKNSIAKMKKGVILVNTARGKCINEQDLADALESGHVAAYATDVWYSDPPEASPLLKAKNVLMAPHIGASSRENLLRISDRGDRILGKHTTLGLL